MIISGKLLAGGFLLIGGWLLFQIIWSVISFQLLSNSWTGDLSLISPQKEVEVKGISVKTEDNFPNFISTIKRQSPTPYEQFSLSVPVLKIDGQIVLVDSNDLNKGLVHLPGSALPGEKGNVFISGHSALPVFFTKGQKTLFANLQNLTKGDLIKVGVGGSQFEYKVINIKIVDPKDLSVILPPDETGRYISLMTCVPLGLNTKRLVVLGQLQ